jgi:hypothetical protein
VQHISISDVGALFVGGIEEEASVMQSVRVEDARADDSDALLALRLGLAAMRTRLFRCWDCSKGDQIKIKLINFHGKNKV